MLTHKTFPRLVLLAAAATGLVACVDPVPVEHSFGDLRCQDVPRALCVRIVGVALTAPSFATKPRSLRSAAVWPTDCGPRWPQCWYVEGAWIDIERDGDFNANVAMLPDGSLFVFP